MIFFMKSRVSKTLLILVLTLSGSTAVTGVIPRVRGQAGLPVVGVWSDAYGSSNVTDTSLVVGSTVTFEANVTDAPAFNGYEFSLYYDPGFLKAQSDDILTGTVFDHPFVGANDLSTPGVVSVAIVNLGSAFTGGSGTLIHITFSIVNVGDSPLALAQGTASPGIDANSWTRLVIGTNTIAVTTTDGYFKNDPARLGPVARFSQVLTNPILGGRQIFDASASFDPDNSTGANRGIVLYSWDFGDGYGETTLYPVISHRFAQALGGLIFNGNFSVRLTVTDANDGLEGMVTEPLVIPRISLPTVDFSVFTFPTFTFLPGASSSTIVQVFSIGDFQGPVSLTAHISPAISNGPVVGLKQNILKVPGGNVASTFLSINTTVTTTPGKYGVIVTATNGTLTHSGLTLLNILDNPIFPNISVQNYYTDGSGNPLPLDLNASPSVNVVIAHGVLRATNPGQIFAWANMTNTGTLAFSSLRIEETLPPDWMVSPMNAHSSGGLQVLFELGNKTLLDITPTAPLTLSGTNPENLELTIQNLTATAGRLLAPGESILVSEKLEYDLIGSTQSPRNFPKTYTMATEATAWAMTGFTGTGSSSTTSASFNADPKIMGDVNGDFQINIVDLALVAYSYNSRPGSPNWNVAADLDGSHKIDIQDLAIVAFNLGDSY